MTNDSPSRPTASRARARDSSGFARCTKLDRNSIVREVCAGMLNGSSVSELLRRMKGSPEQGTFWAWLREDSALREVYEAALLQRAHQFAEELVGLADGAEATPEGVAKAKLQVNTRQWVIARLLPKKYGAALRTEVTGAEGGPVQIDHHRGIGPSLKAAAAALDAVLARQDEPRLPEREPIRHFGQQEN